MGQLHICFEPLPHPHNDVPSSRFEHWGKVRIEIVPDKGGEHTLFESQWNLEIFAVWFAEHGRGLCHDELRIDGQGPRHNESIALARQRLLSEWVVQEEKSETVDHDTVETSEWFDKLDAYHERHSLREASQGLTMPPIYIGLNHGVGEISVATDDATWEYTFDMDDFCEDVHARLVNFIEEWSQEDLDPDVRTFVMRLLHRLRDGRPRPARRRDSNM